MNAHTGRVKALELETTQGHAGSITRESQFVTRYAEEAIGHPERALSLTMPVTLETYSKNQLPPILTMHFPEGFLLDHLYARYGKSVDLKDPMNMLALTSSPNTGRVHAYPPGERADGISQPVSLKELLASKGTEELFRELVERFAPSNSISGVQPKVVVLGKADAIHHDEAIASSKRAVEKSWLSTPDLIVKSAAAGYPQLTENEFHCMSIVRAAQLEVPEFWLSDDKSLFVIRRFDIHRDGGFRGFEDMAVLTGRQPENKYEGSYANVAKALIVNCAPAERLESVERFFRQLVLCCVLRNGDAHLKNWGILYDDPSTADHDARLTPAFDMVCTAVYIESDTLALSLGGTKAWPSRAELLKFGREKCQLPRPERSIEQALDAASSYRPAESSEIWARMKAVIDEGVFSIA